MEIYWQCIHTYNPLSIICELYSETIRTEHETQLGCLVFSIAERMDIFENWWLVVVNRYNTVLYRLLRKSALMNEVFRNNLWLGVTIMMNGKLYPSKPNIVWHKRYLVEYNIHNTYLNVLCEICKIGQQYHIISRLLLLFYSVLHQLRCLIYLSNII